MGEDMVLSVIVPTWNSLAHVTRLVDDWFEAQAPGIRLVIVDDGSEDGTLQYLVTRAELRDLLFLRQGNLGPGAARNLGLQAVDTPLVSFADVDDIVNWRELAVAAHFMLMHPSVDVLTCPINKASPPAAGARLAEATGRERLKFLADRMAVWGRIYRTSFIRELAPVFPATRAAEDVVATVRIAAAASTIASLPQSFYRHRLSDAGLTRRDNYSELALESLDLLGGLPIDRVLKLYALGASAKYFALRGEMKAAAQTLLIAERVLRRARRKTAGGVAT